MPDSGAIASNEESAFDSRKLMTNVMSKSGEIASRLNQITTKFEVARKELLETFSELSNQDKLKLAEEHIGRSRDISRQIADLLGNFKKVNETLVHCLDITSEVKKNIHGIEGLSKNIGMVSLNVSIEASRGDNSGNTFAAIAKEIRNLAENSKGLVAKVDEAVEGSSDRLQELSGEVSGAIESGNAIIREGGEVFDELGSVLKQSIESTQQAGGRAKAGIQKLEDLSEEIRSSSEGLNSTVTELIEEISGTKVIHLEPEEAKDRLGSVSVIDVRRPDEFNDELGHINGAELITLCDDFGAKLGHHSLDAEILFVCRSGGRSARASQMAQVEGFQAVYNLRGGMLLWNKTFR